MAAALRLFEGAFQTITQIIFVFTMEKHLKVMTSDDLLIKFKEDGVNAKVASTVGGENLLSLRNPHESSLLVPIQYG